MNTELVACRFSDNVLHVLAADTLIDVGGTSLDSTILNYFKNELPKNVNRKKVDFEDLKRQCIFNKEEELFMMTWTLMMKWRSMLILLTQLHQLNWPGQKDKFLNIVMNFSIKLSEVSVCFWKQQRLVDFMLLSGGCAEIPELRREIYNEFKIVDPHCNVKQNTAAASGASLIAAGRFSGQQKFSVSEITTSSLGIKVKFGQFNVLLEKGSRLPCSCTEEFANEHDNQTQLVIQIYQGEGTRISRLHTLLGEILVDIQPRKAFEFKFKVSFSLSINNVLNVSAIDMQNQQLSSICIKRKY
ncbi:hypothetical protein GEMRC1_007668 [Eukaryota sp. GEM-RC1]